jgi:hypothetical protein
MAAPTTMTQRLEVLLQAVRAEVDDLPAWEEAWPTLSDAEQASWSLNWDHVMATYLVDLDEAYRAGTMTSDQQTRYRAVLDRLSRLLPLIERLDLYRPPVPLTP